jgi:hypothetical protein
MRLAIAYLIGLNVFGLLYALTYLVGGLLQMAPIDTFLAESQRGDQPRIGYVGHGRLKRYERAMDRKSYVDRRELRRLLTYRLDKPRAVMG